MVLRGALLLAAAVLPAFASDEWIRVSTPHFEICTTAGERRGRELALEFERVREFFERVSPLKAPGDARVRIILFRTEEQYAQYAMNAVAVAFYASAPTRDYIVLQDSPQRYPTAIHEYMHLMIRHSGLRIPLWLNEGWSDVYSTLRPTRDGVAVGDLLPGRMKTLEQGAWMDFADLTSTTPASSAYSETNHAGIFYAESWALAHMLYLAPDYKDHFAQFVVALHRGATTAEACRIAYGKTPAEVYDDLRNYLARRKLYGAVFEAPRVKPSEEPRAEKLSAFDADLMLTDLLAATGRTSVARSEYERLEKLQPGNPEVAEGLGFISLGVGDHAEARMRFQKAFDAGESDPKMCLQLARLQRETGAAPAAIIPVLERAIRARPDDTEAQIQLGETKLAARDFPGAIATLAAIRTVPPNEATSVFSALAYASVQTGDLESARGYSATALKWASTEPQRNAIAQLNTLIDARSRVAVRKGERLAQTAGTAMNIVCSAAGNRLEIVSSGHALTFEMPDSRAIEFSRAGGGPFEMRCGPQASLPVSVEYVPAPAGSVLAGVVRRIEVGPANKEVRQ